MEVGNIEEECDECPSLIAMITFPKKTSERDESINSNLEGETDKEDKEEKNRKVPFSLVAATS